MEFGADLSGQNTMHITAKNPDDLERIFGELRLPYRVITIYPQGKRLIAWLNVSTALKKKILRKKTKIKEIRNGSIK